MTFDDFLKEWRDNGDFITAYTSGSTGIPKKIQLSKKFVTASAMRTISFFTISPESRLHSCVAADFIGGKMMAVRAELSGCSLTYETPSNRPLSDVDKDECIDLLAVVPSQMIHILDNIRDIPHIKAFIIGGAPLGNTLRRRIIDAGLNAYETYGMTETASHIALRKVAAGVDSFSLLPGITVNLDPEGCLIISFDSGEIVKTNDMASLTEFDSFRIDGRRDDIIITGGKKLNPHEVEEKISDLIPFPYIISSVADIKWGEKVILKIEANDIDTDSIERELRERLDSWQVPKEIICVNQLPRTANGKLKRR